MTAAVSKGCGWWGWGSAGRGQREELRAARWGTTSAGASEERWETSVHLGRIGRCPEAVKDTSAPTEETFP